LIGIAKNPKRMSTLNMSRRMTNILTSLTVTKDTGDEAPTPSPQKFKRVVSNLGGAMSVLGSLSPSESISSKGIKEESEVDDLSTKGSSRKRAVGILQASFSAASHAMMSAAVAASHAITEVTHIDGLPDEVEMTGGGTVDSGSFRRPKPKPDEGLLQSYSTSLSPRRGNSYKVLPVDGGVDGHAGGDIESQTDMIDSDRIDQLAKQHKTVMDKYRANDTSGAGGDITSSVQWYLDSFDPEQAEQHHDV
jgi:hypothetical protein